MAGKELGKMSFKWINLTFDTYASNFFTLSKP